MSTPSEHMAQGMLVFWIASLDDYASPCLVNHVTRDPRLQSGEISIIRIASSLEHLLHSLWHSSGADEVVSLDVATVTVILDAKVQFYKIAILDLSTIVAHVGHRSVADHHGGASIIRPCRIQFSLSQKLVRKVMDVLVPLARLDRALDSIVDLFALSNRFLH